jgi:hypothetical protein
MGINKYSNMRTSISGRCKYCKRISDLKIKVFMFPIKCECCNGNTHYEKISHCKNCKPVIPKYCTISCKSVTLLDPIGEGLFKKVKDE